MERHEQGRTHQIKKVWPGESLPPVSDQAFGNSKCLVGGRMEREAYLDVLLPPAQETGGKPKSGKPIDPSR